MVQELIANRTDPQETTFVEKIAWLIFCGNCVQLVFQESYVVILPGVKSDVFSGLLCSVALAACMVAVRRPLAITPLQVVVSLGLLLLGTASALTSLTPWSSLIHIFVLGSTGLGGFWCGRILLRTPDRQRSFLWFCLIILIVLLISGFWGYWAHGVVNYELDDLHQTVALVVLMSFSPLALLSKGKPYAIVVGMVVLILSYVILYLCGMSGVEVGVLIPLGTIFVAMLVSIFQRGLEPVLVVVLLLVTGVTAHYVSNVSQERFSGKGYQAERFEYYHFSEHIAKKHPWLGIGLRSPRQRFLDDYKVWHPHYTHEEFSRAVSSTVTSQNMFITLMVGLGIPFAALYVTCLIILFVRLIRTCGEAGDSEVIPPMALILPLVGALMHLCVMDLLLMPQISWFFHLLLGLIPSPVKSAAGDPKPRTSPWGSVAVTVGVIAVGILVGTHPSLDLKRLPWLWDIGDRLKNLPLVKTFVEKSQADVAPARQADGWISVKISGSEVLPAQWAIVFILDNSKRMEQEDEPWHPSRLKAGQNLIRLVARAIPEGSRIEIRAFADEGPVRRNNREFFLRTSRVIQDWTSSLSEDLDLDINNYRSDRRNDLCNSLEISAFQDFLAMPDGMARRVVLITDGNSPCGVDETIDEISSADFAKRGVIVDVIALGMSESAAATYSHITQRTKGLFLSAESPAASDAVARRYVEGLRKPIQHRIVVSGNNKEYEAGSGQEIQVPPGIYTLTFPDIVGSEGSETSLPNIVIKSAERQVVAVSIAGGKAIRLK